MYKNPSTVVSRGEKPKGHDSGKHVIERLVMIQCWINEDLRLALHCHDNVYNAVRLVKRL